ncbi:MAG: hypothetical protein IT383_20880 [Deltaproteobacteria bacterium]|nr:hypothetical protein [Deltaproteobacteria bacterium]
MSNADKLVHAGAAVATGAARFIPLPFVDDWVATLSRRQLVASILKRHGRQFATSDLKQLYDDGGSLLGLPFRVAKGLVLAPIKKLFRTVFFVFALRDVAMAAGKTVALGHTLDRALGLGAFRDEDTRAHRRDEARRLRKALDSAYAKIDERLVRRAANALIDRVKKVPTHDDDIEGFLAELDRRVDQALLDVV